MAESVVKRSDPFEFPRHIVPIGLKYQWVDRGGDAEPSFLEMRDRGWISIPPEWHPGIWDEETTAGHDIVVKNNVLMGHACPRDEEAERIAGAQKNIDDWATKFGGFSGGVRIRVGNEPVKEMRMGDPILSEKIAPSAETIIAYQGNPSQRAMQVEWTDPPKPPQPIEIALCLRPHPVPRHGFLRWLFRLVSMEGS